MNWDGFSWLKERSVEPLPLQPGEQVIRCPKCQTDLPAAALLILTSWVKRDGQFVPIETGKRMACQLCPAQWSMGPNGPFMHHEQSWPLTATQSNPTNYAGIPEDDPPMAGPPRPRIRPRSAP